MTAHDARDDDPKLPQSAREWHELALGHCTCPDDDQDDDDRK